MSRGASAIALTLLAVATQSLSAEAPPELLPLRGTDIFRALLHRQGLSPHFMSTGLEIDSLTLLVIYGQMPTRESPFGNYAERVREVLDAGGAVLIATNQPGNLSNCFPPGTMAINPHSIRDADHCYRKFADLPFLDLSAASDHRDYHLQAISRLRNVATNRPSSLRFTGGDHPFVELGGFSDSATVEGPGRRGAAIAFSPRRLGVAVVIADAGILSNEMLASSDLHNFEFASHLASYLASGPEGKRRRIKCIFWDTRSLRRDFETVPLSAPMPQFRPPWPAIQKTIADGIDRKANELQQRDSANRGLFNAIPYPVPRLGAAVAVVVLLALIVRVWASRSDLRKLAKHRPNDGTAAGAMLEAQNLHAAARERLRIQFAAWQVPDSPHRPTLAAEGSRFYRYRMDRAFRSLWRLAYRDAADAVDRPRWRQIERDIAALDDALRTGRVRIAAERES